jgi:Flp pilus assembly protein TadB
VRPEWRSLKGATRLPVSCRARSSSARESGSNDAAMFLSFRARQLYRAAGRRLRIASMRAKFERSIRSSQSTARPDLNLPNFLLRVLGVMLGIAMFVAAFIFASVILAIVAAAALVIWGWVWWRTRDIRRAMREGESVVIEGEYRVERDVNRIDDDRERRT